VPLACIAPTGSIAATGAATTLGVESSERGSRYVLYVVSTAAGAPNPWDGETSFAG